MFLPNTLSDLALSLAGNYMPSYDNLDTLSADKSDLLCVAATGGGFSKRTLYTDEDETILFFQRCVTLNGINVVATRPDLLDRSIVRSFDRSNSSAFPRKSAGRIAWCGRASMQTSRAYWAASLPRYQGP
ncbi:MAG: hypothetical protein OWU32_13900 [Firmicutes bacterium]|nr:hypothetical protein [Bacillota bacterium]